MFRQTTHQRLKHPVMVGPAVAQRNQIGLAGVNVAYQSRAVSQHRGGIFAVDSECAGIQLHANRRVGDLFDHPCSLDTSGHEVRTVARRAWLQAYRYAMKTGDITQPTKKGNRDSLGLGVARTS